MNEHEELLPATRPTDAEEPVVDLDDVEGHGLREVAAGLGAAAVLAGGAGVAAASTASVHPSDDGPPGPTPVTLGSPVSGGDRVIDRGIRDARAERDAALAAAEQAATPATATEARLLTGAEQVAAGAPAAAVSAVESTVRSVRATEESALRTADVAAYREKADATRKAATVLQLSTRTVSPAVTQLEMSVATLNPQASAGVGPDGVGGWVSLQVGGRTLAQVQVVDGVATLDLEAADLAGKVLTLVYSGDAVHASSTRSMTL